MNLSTVFYKCLGYSTYAHNYLLAATTAFRDPPNKLQRSQNWGLTP